MTTEILGSATDRAAKLEQEIRAKRSEREALIQARPLVSQRDLALASRGEGTATMPTAEAVGRFDDAIRLLDATIDGLCELRMEIEPAVIAERVADLDVKAREITAKTIAPVAARLKEIELERVALEGELVAGQHERSQVAAERHRLYVATQDARRGLRSAHFTELCDRIGCPPAQRAAILRGLEDPTASAFARGDAQSARALGLV